MITYLAMTARVSRALGLFGSLVLVSACLFFSSQAALAQFSQQGPKLVGAEQGAQGISVALSADGNTAIVGAPHRDGAWVFTRSGKVWAQQGDKLGIGTARMGSSVALSADGNTAVLGEVDGIGGAWVFTRGGKVWAQQGDKLVGTDAVAGTVVGGGYGNSVALSADGNTAIVGAPADNNERLGATWVFTRSGGVWTQQGNKLVGTGAVAGTVIGWGQGHSVALSADGNTAVVGAPHDNDGIGAAWIFTKPPQ